MHESKLCQLCQKKKNKFKSLNTDYFLIHSYKALKCFFSSVTHMFLRSTNRITCKSRDLLLLCPLQNFSLTELNLGKSYLSDLHEHQREETKLNGLAPFFFSPSTLSYKQQYAEIFTCQSLLCRICHI